MCAHHPTATFWWDEMWRLMVLHYVTYWKRVNLEELYALITGSSISDIADAAVHQI